MILIKKLTINYIEEENNYEEDGNSNHEEYMKDNII